MTSHHLEESPSEEDWVATSFGPRRSFRLSREERNYVAGHALDSISREAHDLWSCTTPTVRAGGQIASDRARRIAALSNLLGDIGWEREARSLGDIEGRRGFAESFLGDRAWTLGELFPTAQLRPWLEQWVGGDTEVLGASMSDSDAQSAQTKLGTGALLLTRLEKWMASHEN